MVTEDKYIEIRWVMSEQCREDAMVGQRTVISLEGLLLLIDFK